MASRHRTVYDELATQYAERASSLEPVTEAALTPLLALLPPDSRALDVGCGAAVPSGFLAAGGHRTFGIDLSPRMVEVASARVPEGAKEAGRTHIPPIV